jgi:hypothetical protein
MLATTLAVTGEGHEALPTAALLLPETFKPLLINFVTAVTHTDLTARTDDAGDPAWSPTRGAVRQAAAWLIV